MTLAQAYSQPDLEKRLNELKSKAPEKLSQLQGQASKMAGYERVRDAATEALSAASPATQHSGEEKAGTRRPLENWVEGQWSDPNFKGEQKATETEVTKAQLYAEFGKVAPHLPRELRVCLVGHAWVEQHGQNVLNFNFAGDEGESSAFVLGWTSAVIPTSTYETEPDKSKYRDWDMSGHNPNFGNWDKHPAGTIASQLAIDPKPSQIVVCARRRRPAYQSLSDAAASFIKLIEVRVAALQASKNPDDNKLGETAFAGDAHSYAYIVNHRINIIDTNGKRRNIGPYNSDSGYAKLVETQIALAETDLAKTPQ